MYWAGHFPCVVDEHLASGTMVYFPCGRPYDGIVAASRETWAAVAARHLAAAYRPEGVP